MCDDDEVWHVAGHRRRRHAAGSGSSKPKIHRRVGRIPASSTTNGSSNSITTTANTASTAANSNTNTSTNYTGNSTTRGAQGGTINGKTNSGYSYSTRAAGRKPQRQQSGQQRLAGNGEELVRTELQKLEQLKALLVETALWQRLVEGLKSIFPQLGLAFPAPEQSRQVLGNGLSKSKEAAFLRGGSGDSAAVGRDSRTTEAVQFGGGSEKRQQQQQQAKHQHQGGEKPEEEQQQEEQQQQQQSQQQQQHQQHHHQQYHHHHHHEVLSELVCYGVGNFTESHSSRYQLALALCLRDLLFPARNNSATHPTASYEGGREETNSSKGDICTAGAQKVDALQLRCSDGVETSPTDKRSENLECSEKPGRFEKRFEEHYQKTERWQGVSTPGPNILFFDPMMGEGEKNILAALGCGLLENEEGKRSCYDTEGGVGEGRGRERCGGVGKGGRGGYGGGVKDGGGGGCCCGLEGGAGKGSGGGCCCGVEAGAPKGGGDGDIDEGRRRRRRPTLFFMPHCPQRLYSNVLWANWSSSGLGSVIILGNKLSSYRDRTLSTAALCDPTNSILRSGPLLKDFDLVPYQGTDKKKCWKRDVERLPRLERAFNDLTLSFSSPAARASPEGVMALRDRPQEFVEEVDGELITGRVGLHDGAGV